MKISVVTVCFNSARTVGHTLESFFAQDHADKELLVIDGASTDDTLKIVKSFPSTGVTVVSEPDGGLYDAMNKGLARFSGEAVGFLNSDDRYADARALSAIAKGFNGADIVCGDLDFVSDHETGRIVRSWRGSDWSKGAFARGWMPAHPTFYARRRVVEKVGAFDPALRIAADYDYMLRAVELGGFTTAHVPRVLVHMMAGGASTRGIGGYVRSNFEALRSRRRHLGSGVVDAALLAKPLGKIGQFLGR